MSDLHTFKQRQRLHLANRRALYVLTHTERRRPSRRGLVVAMAICAAGVLFSLWLMFEATLPAGLPR